MYETSRLNKLAKLRTDPDAVIQHGISEFCRGTHYNNVLDYGAGNSPYRHCISHNVYQTADISQNYTNTIDYIITPGAKLNIRNCTFDAVLLLDVLEHVSDPEFVIHEIRRLLRPEGVLIISLPFMYREHETPRDYFRFTSFGAVELLQKCGGKVIAIEKVGNVYLTVLTLFLERGIYNGEQNRFGLFGKAINKFLRLVYFLFNPIFISAPPASSGCYHHLLLKVRFVS